MVDGKHSEGSRSAKTFLIELGDSDDGLILDSSISKPRNHKHADEGTPIFNIQPVLWSSTSLSA